MIRIHDRTPCIPAGITRTLMLIASLSIPFLPSIATAQGAEGSSATSTPMSCEQYVLCALDTSCTAYFDENDQVCGLEDATGVGIAEENCESALPNVLPQSEDENLYLLLDSIAEASLSQYENNFLQGIGYPALNGAGESPYTMTSSQGYQDAFELSSYSGDVEIAVFDDLLFSTPTDPDDLGFSSTGHGLSMTTLITQVACIDSNDFDDCDTSFKLHDVLSDEKNNAFTLARAICEAAEAHPSSSKPLVMNFSLGFPADDPNAEYVERALKWNMCKNPKTLSFASSGNVKMTDWDVYDDQGILAPAAWESVEFSSFQSDCTAMGFTPNADAELFLVYAVGATDIDKVPLNTSRIDSVPGLVVMGDHATGENIVFGRRTPPMSGTSVGPAVLSGLATQLWKDRDYLSAKDIIDEIYDTTPEVVGDTPGYCPYNGTDPLYTCKLRSISVSETINQVFGNEDTVIQPIAESPLFPNLTTLNYVNWTAINPGPIDIDSQPNSIGCGACSVLLTQGNANEIVLPMESEGILYKLRIEILNMRNQVIHSVTIFDEPLPELSASSGDAGAGMEGTDEGLYESLPSAIDLICHDIVLPMTFDTESQVHYFSPNGNPHCLLDPTQPFDSGGISIPLIWRGEFEQVENLYKNAASAVAVFYVENEEGLVELGHEPVTLRKER